MNTHSRRFIASRKTCIAASSHRVFVKGLFTQRASERCSNATKGPFTQRASDDAAMHAFLDAMKRRDRVFTLYAIKPLFPHCQLYISVVKLETCPMRAINVAMDLARDTSLKYIVL